MTSIPKQMAHLFFPPKMPEQSEITFKTVAEAVNRQRAARITKAAIFALSSIVGTITLVLTEAAVIAWPLAIPAIVISLTAAAIFWRLNSLDKRYLEGIDDKTRAAVSKNEIERILLSKETLTPKEITKSLKNVNRVLGNDVFSKENIETILLVKREAALSKTPKSLAQVAFEQNVSLAFNSISEWTTQGRYGLPSYDYKLEVVWDGNPENPMNIEYQSKEANKDAEEEGIPEPTKAVEPQIDPMLTPAIA